MDDQKELNRKRAIAGAVLALFDKEILTEVDALEVAVNVYGYVCLLCELSEKEAVDGVVEYYKANGGVNDHASH